MRPQLEPVPHRHLVPSDGTFRIARESTEPPADGPSKKENQETIERLIPELQELQSRLYADDRYAILLIFQALDAAGKDGTIRAVMTGINPAGCQVFSFKRPSEEELDHDFLWRTSRSLPERGRIGIFNRSYYEEVLVQRVHSEWLDTQRIPGIDPQTVWTERFESIIGHEKHLAYNGTVLLKFFLNVSKREQKKRLLDRIEEKKSNWKFRTSDVEERERWDDYMAAYEAALNATSKPWAPWYAVPADNKSYMRAVVCEIFAARLRSLGLSYPKISKEQQQELEESKKILSRD